MSRLTAPTRLATNSAQAMKLPLKTLLILLMITLISFSSSILIRQTVVLPELIALEAKADRKDAERVVIGVDMIRNRLSMITYDYGVWDDTYNYYTDKDNDYLANNYLVDMFIANELNVVVLTDASGQAIWSALADLNTEEFLPNGVLNTTELTPYMADSTSAKPGAPISTSGIINTSNGIIIYASTSVQKSDDSGGSPGSILMGRYIDENTVDEIKDMVKIDFSLALVKPEDSTLTDSHDFSGLYRNDNDTINVTINDVSDRPLLRLAVQLEPRTFNDQLLTRPMLTALAVMLACWLLVVLVLNHTLVHPILMMGGHLFEIRKTGDYSKRLASTRKDEVGDLINECDRLIEYVEKQQLILTQQSKELHKLSFEDGLTGLANRRRFDQLLQDYWTLSQRDKTPISLIMCDIDFFKPFNDHYGHQLGDRALKKVADAIRKSISRQSDLAARYGGEEFVLILPNTDSPGAEVVASRIHDNIQQAAIVHQYSAVSSHVTISVGIATLDTDSDLSVEQLLRQADQALYQAKAQGRNSSVIFGTQQAATA